MQIQTFSPLCTLPISSTFTHLPAILFLNSVIYLFSYSWLINYFQVHSKVHNIVYTNEAIKWIIKFFISLRFSAFGRKSMWKIFGTHPVRNFGINTSSQRQTVLGKTSSGGAWCPCWDRSSESKLLKSILSLHCCICFKHCQWTFQIIHL